jgi:hypothetical protein
VSVQREEIEGEEAHIAALTVALLEDGLDAFVAIAGAGFTVKHGGVHGPAYFSEPSHPGMSEQIPTRTAVAGNGAALADVDLDTLPIEFGLRDISALGEPF